MEKLVVSPEEGCEVIGVKRSTIFSLMKTGQIRSVKIGRLRRIPVVELEAFLARQVAAQNEEPPTEKTR
jgi:excisionase family DNA binding protein